MSCCSRVQGTHIKAHRLKLPLMRKISFSRRRFLGEHI
jgi:hypothetical protein